MKHLGNKVSILLKMTLIDSDNIVWDRSKAPYSNQIEIVAF